LIRHELAATQQIKITEYYLQNETVDEALVRLRDRCILQPCLFTAQQHFFLKVDNTAIPLLSASCFTEAVEQVFMAFWVFNVEYPNSLRVFYEFVGHMMALDKFKVGPTIRSLLHELQKLATAQPS
jgi:hypothetical protein